MNIQFHKTLAILLISCLMFCSPCLSQEGNDHLAIGNEAFENGDFEAAKEHYQRAVESYSQSNQGYREADARLYLAKSYTHLRQIDSALVEYRKAYHEATENDWIYLKVFALNAETVILNFRGNYPESKRKLKTLINLNYENFPKLSDSTHVEAHSFLSDAYTCMGNLYVNSRQLDSAIFYFKKAIVVDSVHQDMKSIPFNYAALGNIYNIRGKNEAALTNYLLGIEKLRAERDSFKICAFAFNIGNTFLKLNNLEKAQEYGELSESLATQFGISQEVGNSNFLLGRIAKRNGDYHKAIEHFKNAYEAWETWGKSGGMLKSISQIMSCYNHLGDRATAQKWENTAAWIIKDNPQLSSDLSIVFARVEDKMMAKDFEAAFEIINAADISEQISEYPYDQLYFSEMTYKVHKALGKTDLALGSLEKHLALKDSLFQAEQNYLVHDMEAKYDKANKEKEIASLDAENKIKAIEIELKNRQLWLSIIAALIALIVGIVLFSLYRTIKKVNAEIEKKNVIITKALSEKELLLREIHHRVKNNLQVVSSLLSIQSREIEDEKALEAVNESRNRVKSMALIHQDLYQEDNLIGIEAQNYIRKLSESLFHSYKVDADKVSLTTDIQDLKMDVDTSIPIGLILNELITNSLKYAFPDKREGEIKVRLHEVNNKLELEVSDNGVGVDNNSPKGTSFGYKMISAFARKLEAEWEMTQDHGTSVTLYISKYKLS